MCYCFQRIKAFHDTYSTEDIRFAFRKTEDKECSERTFKQSSEEQNFFCCLCFSIVIYTTNLLTEKVINHPIMR